MVWVDKVGQLNDMQSFWQSRNSAVKAVTDNSGCSGNRIDIFAEIGG